MCEFWADVAIQLVPTASGGRTALLVLCNDNPGQYRPHICVIGGSREMLGVAFMDGPDEPIPPGESTQATIKSLYEPNVWRLYGRQVFAGVLPWTTATVSIVDLLGAITPTTH